jgi:glutamyl-tRNA reductase
MRLIMAGLDHETAEIGIREIFSPAAGEREGILRRLRAIDGIAGAVFLVTCNRAELYLSHGNDPAPDCVGLLCQGVGVSPDNFRPYFRERGENEAIIHLMRVAGGIRSGVLGDNQIITQTRKALEEARRAGVSDPLTEALFRFAVTAGKRVRAALRFSWNGKSVAAEAIRRAEERLGGSLSGLRVLVVGNGEVGRLAAAILLEKGCRVTMASRRPHREENLPNPGLAQIPYENRYLAMAGQDLVISATTSPHTTIKAAETTGLHPHPGLFLDLGAPRDIDPAVGELPGVTLWNVDEFVDNRSREENRLLLSRAEEILGEESKRFSSWRRNRGRRLATRPDLPDFPIFVSLRGAQTLVIGGGGVAARRTGALLSFGAKVKVVAPELSGGMERHLGREGLVWEKRDYRSQDMEGVTLAVAATDNREVNRQAGLDARERSVLISVADRREECSFFFPALIQSDRLVAGLVSKNGDHPLVRAAAVKIRGELEKFDVGHPGGFAEKRPGAGPGGAGDGSCPETASRRQDGTDCHEDRGRSPARRSSRRDWRERAVHPGA